MDEEPSTFLKLPRVFIKKNLPICSDVQKMIDGNLLKEIPNNVKSRYWDYYKLTLGEKIVCIVCGLQSDFNIHNGSSYRRHLSIRHTISFEDEETTPLKHKSSSEIGFLRIDKEYCKRMLFSWITNNSVASSVLDHTELRELFRYLNFNSQGRRAYTLDLEDREKGIDCEIRRILSNRYVSIVSDMWKSQSKNHFIVISVHYLNNSFQPEHITTWLKLITKSSSDNIQRSIQEMLNYYEIEGVVSSSTDNGANMCKSLKNMNITNINCMCHTSKTVLTLVQLVIKDSLKNSGIKVVMSKFETL